MFVLRSYQGYLGVGVDHERPDDAISFSRYEDAAWLKSEMGLAEYEIEKHDKSTSLSEISHMLRECTRLWPTGEHHRHALTIDDNKLSLNLRINNQWSSFTFSDDNLTKPVDEIISEIKKLIE